MRPHYLLLTLIVVAGAVLRWQGIGESLWLDELHTSWIVAGGWGDVAPRAMIGNQPPLPYWPLWLYVQAVGNNEWTLRLPSVLASCAAIVAVYALAWRWTLSSSAALLAALALAVNADSFAFYGNEARVYALGQLLAILHILAFDELQRSGQRRWRAVWVVGCWLLIYVHYTLALLVVAELVAWCLCRLRARTAYQLKQLLVDATVVALGWLPALWHMASIARERERWELFIERPSWSDLLTMVPNESALWWLLAGWLGLAVVSRFKQQPLEPLPTQAAWPLAISWLVAPLTISWALSYFDLARLFYPRYLVYVLPAGGVVIALLSAMLRPPPLRVFYSIAAALTLTAWNVWLMLAIFGGLSAPREENWRDAIARLNERQWQAGEPLLVASNLIECDRLRTSEDPALREFCLYPLHAAYPLRAPQAAEIPLPMTDTGRLSEGTARRARQWLEAHGDLLLVLRGSEAVGKRTSRELEDALGQDAACTFVEAFGNVRLYRLALTDRNGR